MLPHKKYRNSLTDAIVMKLRFSFVCLLFYPRMLSKKRILSLRETLFYKPLDL